MNALDRSLALSAALALTGIVPAQVETRRPNIVVILVDDMGFSDIGCYGSEIPTPNIDRLAAGGARFTQFYNTGRCCPTRAALLTGLYPHQTGVGHMTADSGVDGYRGRLNDRCVTIAEALDGTNYFTAMAGKWHVGHDAGVTPATRGFRRSINLPAGGVYQASASNKCRLFLDGKRIQNDDPRLPQDWYLTDLWTDYGIRFLDEAIASEQPFFLYLAHVAPHFPLQASAEDIARFRGKYLRGWDELGKERLARMRASGLLDPDWQPAPRPEQVAAWESLSEQERNRFDHLMATYAAVMYRLDVAIGRFVQALEERNALDDTLILFLSDNGGNAESGPRGRTKGDPTTAESNWYCGRSWAHLQNTPFAWYKHYNHEGGIATPMIAHWPAAIAAGRVVREPAHVIDVMATCLDLAGVEYPETRNGKPITPAEGLSLRPALTGSGALPERTLFFEHEGHAAVRAGDRKLVRRGRGGRWQLYDMVEDRTEQHDLAAEQPAAVQQLETAWNAWAHRCNVLPKPARKASNRKQNKDGRKPGASKQERERRQG